MVILAAVGFSASALRLAARERYMAWSYEQRQACLHHVAVSEPLSGARIVQASGQSCTGPVLGRLPDDFEGALRVPSLGSGGPMWAPDWEGTCFKAANFQHIGYTAGNRHQEEETPKALYVYELERLWRKRLGECHRWSCFL